jgi:hypothetical protein
MANKGTQGQLGATDSSPRPGCFPVGSAQSRAAARAMLVARREAEKGGIRFVVRSIVDGSPVNLDGLADRLRAARLRLDIEEGTASIQANESGQERSGGSWEECLAERIRKARERVERAQGPDSIF